MKIRDFMKSKIPKTNNLRLRLECGVVLLFLSLFFLISLGTTFLFILISTNMSRITISFLVAASCYIYFRDILIENSDGKGLEIDEVDYKKLHFIQKVVCRILLVRVVKGK